MNTSTSSNNKISTSAATIVRSNDVSDLPTPPLEWDNETNTQAINDIQTPYFNTTTDEGEGSGSYMNDNNGNNNYKRTSSSNNTYSPYESWLVGDHYQLVRILGKGSYGEVVEAIDKR